MMRALLSGEVMIIAGTMLAGMAPVADLRSDKDADGVDQRAGPAQSVWGPSSGAYFERPPVSAPSIATERYVEPLRGGPAAGSPTGGSLRGH